MVRILIVDDVPDVLDCIHTMLSLFGYEAEIAESARQALDKLAVQHYDVLVSDISMPDMNGVKLLEALRRSDSPNRDIYALALTGYSREVLGIELAGFNGYVLKTHYESLLQEIERACSSRKHTETSNVIYTKTIGPCRF